MLLELSIRELAEGLQKGTFSSVDIVTECLKNIHSFDQEIHAFITLLPEEEILKEAKKRDMERTQDHNLLHGIPYVLKDSYNTKGIRTTAASSLLKDFISPYDATVYKKLQDQGAILLGKMNMDAWGHGATSENTDFGPVKNPWDRTRTAGGSTGGVAAAVASRMAVFGIGEDTGGSIRNPSAWCNITGLKVSYGRVSRYGCIAYASSFDTVGPMAKSAEDCAIILQNIAGIDPFDATSSPENVPQYAEEIQNQNKFLTIGMPKEFFGDGLDKEIKKAIVTAAETFKAMGHSVKEISMPSISFGIPVYYLIAPSETSSNLARYDGIRFGEDRSHFTWETKRRIFVGTYALSAGYYDAYYKKAQQARTVFIEEYKKAFQECDVLLMPVTPIHPTILGSVVDDPVQNMLLDIYTVTHNPVGIPSLSLPCGFSKEGLPMGLQISAPMFQEGVLLSLGHSYQQQTSWHSKQPSMMNKEENV